MLQKRCFSGTKEKYLAVAVAACTYKAMLPEPKATNENKKEIYLMMQKRRI